MLHGYWQINQAKCTAELKKQTESYPQFANFDSPEAGDGAGNAPDGPQPKLKLTFNNSGANGAIEEGDEEWGSLSPRTCPAFCISSFPIYCSFFLHVLCFSFSHCTCIHPKGVFIDTAVMEVYGWWRNAFFFFPLLPLLTFQQLATYKYVRRRRKEKRSISSLIVFVSAFLSLSFLFVSICGLCLP